VRDLAIRQIKEMGKNMRERSGDESMNVEFPTGIILACLYMVSHYVSEV
jgi:hypothetical protein